MNVIERRLFKLANNDINAQQISDSATFIPSWITMKY